MILGKKTNIMSLYDIFIMKIKSLYDIELELIDALPLMVEKSTNSELTEAFKKHLFETKNQASRLEKIFDILGKDGERIRGDAIRGLIKDAQYVIKQVTGFDTRDAAMIAAASAVEHYEMTEYMSAIEWARLLGFNDAMNLLQQSMKEEEAAANKLMKIATEKVNASAVMDATEEDVDDME